MKRLFLFLASLLLSGCVYTPTNYNPTNTSQQQSSQCTFDPGHLKSNGERVEHGFMCTAFSAQSKLSLNKCKWVDGYHRQDGTFVAGHNRCKYDINPAQSNTSALPASSYTSTKSSCATRYCGPVKVKGYYRKDGTYVRPHTRKRSSYNRRRK